jgi:hypothetical protein
VIPQSIPGFRRFLKSITNLCVIRQLWKITKAEQTSLDLSNGGVMPRNTSMVKAGKGVKDY